MLYASFSRSYRPVGTDITLAVGGVQTEVPKAGAASEPARSPAVFPTAARAGAYAARSLG